MAWLGETGPVKGGERRGKQKRVRSSWGKMVKKWSGRKRSHACSSLWVEESDGQRKMHWFSGGNGEEGTVMVVCVSKHIDFWGQGEEGYLGRFAVQRDGERNVMAERLLILSLGW